MQNPNALGVGKQIFRKGLHMSKWMKLFMAALMVGFFAGIASAEDANKPMGKRPHRAEMKHDMVQMRLDHLTKKLDLTETQREQVKPILQEEMKQMRDLRGNQIPPEERAAKNARNTHGNR